MRFVNVSPQSDTSSTKVGPIKPIRESKYLQLNVLNFAMFSGLLDRLYCRKADGYRMIMVGIDGAGKTTLLYKLALGQLVITTAPTIGINIETVHVPTTSGRNLIMTCWDVGPGCGIKQLVPMILPYSEYSDAIIWVVDSSERSPQALDESVNILGRLLRATEWDPKPRKDKDCPILM
jgi:GTPase SAR1 family protein